MYRLLMQVFLAVPFCLVAGPAPAEEIPMVMTADAANYEGQFAQVCGLIADTKYARDVRGGPTYINFTDKFPNHDFTALVWARHRKNFNPSPESLKGRKACVFGKVEIYRGKPQVTLAEQRQLLLIPEPAQPAAPEE